MSIVYRSGTTQNALASVASTKLKGRLGGVVFNTGDEDLVFTLQSALTNETDNAYWLDVDGFTEIPVPAGGAYVIAHEAFLAHHRIQIKSAAVDTPTTYRAGLG